LKVPRSPAALVTISAVAIVIVYGVYLLYSIPGDVTGPVPTKFTVGGNTFAFTYIATTEPEREKGLMGARITDSTTMLFAFPSFGEWQFYMYDTNTSLDMIWVNVTGTTGKVVYLVTSAQPCFSSASSCPRFTPDAEANYVIEAKAGFAASYGITEGTDLHFS